MIRYVSSEARRCRICTLPPWPLLSVCWNRQEAKSQSPIDSFCSYLLVRVYCSGYKSVQTLCSLQHVLSPVIFFLTPGAAASAVCSFWKPLHSHVPLITRSSQWGGQADKLLSEEADMQVFSGFMSQTAGKKKQKRGKCVQIPEDILSSINVISSLSSGSALREGGVA